MARGTVYKYVHIKIVMKILAQRNLALIVQATWVVDVAVLYVDTIFIAARTTRHLRTSGRLVQELNVCTVDHSSTCIQTIKKTEMEFLIQF